MKPRNNPFIRPASLVAAVTLGLAALPAQAALFWDGTTSTGDADGGNGTWDNGTSSNWDTLATGGADSVWTNANNDTAVFGGLSGTVTLGAPITVGGLQFDTAGYLVQSNTLTFGVSGNIVTNADATINSALGASSGVTITKTGSGILTLGGNNTYAGNTTISNGTLKAGSTTALSANSVFSVAAGATLDLGGFNNSIKSLSTATGTVTSTGTATLTISTMAQTAQLFTGDLALKFTSNQINNSILTNTANTFSGGITIGSTLTNDRFLLGTGTIGAGTPGALTSGVWGTGAVTLGVTAADRAQILFNGGNTTINNAIVVNSALGNSDAAGTFRVDSTGNVFNGTLTANLANATFRNNGGTGAVTVNGAISGASGLMLSASAGTGLTITLASAANANDYVGNTTISSVKETLTLGATNQIPNGAGKGNLIVTGGTFKMGGFSETINGLSGTGTVDGISGTPTLTVGDNDATGAANTFSGVIKNTAGTLALTKTGSGTLTLSGNNTYGGATTISVGTLKAGSTTALSANSVFSVAAGATLDLGGFNNSIKSLSTATGTVTSTGTATLTISTMAQTAQLFTGDLALKFTSNQINNSILTNTANTFSGGITIGSTLTNDRFLLGTGTIGAGTPGALTSGVWGTGAVTLGVTAADRAQILFNGGNTTINNAIVVNSAVGNTDAAGALRVDTGNNVIAGAINANLAAANFRNGGSGAGGINVTGAISGISGLTLLAGNGTGTLNVTLSNVGTANSYAGNTTISSVKETLTLGAANQIPNGALKGNLIVTAGTFKMNGFSETINGLSGTGTVDGISGTPTLTVGDNDSTSTFDGVITDTAGTLALTKTGSGTLTLTNTNTYTGATNVNSGGTLIVNGSVSTSIQTTVASGATLGGTGMVGALTIETGGTHAPGNSPGIQPVGNYIQNGTLAIEINGLTAGTQHDRVDVTGTVNITGSTLSLTSTGYTAANSDLIFILLNDGLASDTITGTFTGLVDGASVGMIGGKEFKISYFANGDSAGSPSFTGGNDIALMAIPEPRAALLGAISLIALLRRRRDKAIFQS